jgi:glycolate oxidase iron-sulfur subunit
MQTNLADFIRDTAEGQEAESILRSCVHCGFCTATCPTYQLLGDELDGPRGRIYLIKQVLEGHQASEKTRLHLDRCLTCRSCETTCPSGVVYHRLLDIGREVVEAQAPRPAAERFMRTALRTVLRERTRFTPLMRMGQAMRGLLPAALKNKVLARREAGPWPEARHPRRMLVLEGCVQPGLAPDINAAAARVLDRLGISLLRVPGDGCCGALDYHLNAQEAGLRAARRNLDAWWPEIEKGAEAVVITASGCGAFVKDYGHLLREDPEYAEKAARVEALSRDISEVIRDEDLGKLEPRPRKVGFHCPCTLQHALRLRGTVEQILGGLNFELTPVADPHLCCGSAGTYSVFQPTIATELRDNKLGALQAGEPELIATANIGCLTHLQSGTSRPVVHWIQLLDQNLDVRS